MSPLNDKSDSMDNMAIQNKQITLTGRMKKVKNSALLRRNVDSHHLLPAERPKILGYELRSGSILWFIGGQSCREGLADYGFKCEARRARASGLVEVYNINQDFVFYGVFCFVRENRINKRENSFGSLRFNACAFEHGEDLIAMIGRRSLRIDKCSRQHGTGLNNTWLSFFAAEKIACKIIKPPHAAADAGTETAFKQKFEPVYYRRNRLSALCLADALGRESAPLGAAKVNAGIADLAFAVWTDAAWFILPELNHRTAGDAGDVIDIFR
jgi:hypothetical protein